MVDKEDKFHLRSSWLEIKFNGRRNGKKQNKCRSFDCEARKSAILFAQDDKVLGGRKVKQKQRQSRSLRDDKQKDKAMARASKQIRRIFHFRATRRIVLNLGFCERSILNVTS